MNLSVSNKARIYVDGSRTHFKVQEFVTEAMWSRYGAGAVRFVSGWQISFATFLRGRYEAPVYLNNWHAGGALGLRGTRPGHAGLLRHLRGELPSDEVAEVYDRLRGTPGFDKQTLNTGSWVSLHKQAGALDYTVRGLSADQLREDALGHEELFLKHGCRAIEAAKFAPTWCHADNRITGMDSIKIVAPAPISDPTAV